MIKKIIQIFICACYWLCIVPCIIYVLYTQYILRPNSAMDYFIQYSILFLILIIIYWLINHIFDNCYMKNEVRKRVRKITIKRQLERLERGEISLEEAQNFSTFTKPKSPRVRRKGGSSCPGSPALTGKGAVRKGTIAAKTHGKDNAGLQVDHATHRKETKAPKVPPPSYSETVKNEPPPQTLNV